MSKKMYWTLKELFLDTFSHLEWIPGHAEFAGKLDGDFHVVMISRVSAYFGNANLHLAPDWFRFCPARLEKSDLILWG